MLMIIGISFLPLFGFMLWGLFMVFFPETALSIKYYNGSMKGSMFNNSLDFRDGAIIVTRIMGVVVILVGIGIFMLLNGWLDWLVA